MYSAWRRQWEIRAVPAGFFTWYERCWLSYVNSTSGINVLICRKIVLEPQRKNGTSGHIIASATQRSYFDKTPLNLICIINLWILYMKLFSLSTTALIWEKVKKLSHTNSKFHRLYSFICWRNGEILLGKSWENHVYYIYLPVCKKLWKCHISILNTCSHL